MDVLVANAKIPQLKHKLNKVNKKQPPLIKNRPNSNSKISKPLKLQPHPNYSE